MTEHDDRCGARTRGAGGGGCRQAAGWGTGHPGIGRCKLHGGSTPNHAMAAEGELAARALRQLGEPIPMDPTTALQRAVDSAAGLHAGLEALVRDAAGSGDPGSKALAARLQLYADATDRLARVARAAVDARLGERHAALAERQGELLVAAVRTAWHLAKCPDVYRVEFERELGSQLRQMSAN